MRTSQLFENQDPEAFGGNWELRSQLATWQSSCLPKQWQNSCVSSFWQIKNQIRVCCPMYKAYLTSKKKVTSGHSANKHRAQPCFHCFPKQWQTFEFQLIDTRCDKCVFIARPKAYLTSKKKLVTQQTQSKILLWLFSQTMKKHLSINSRWDNYWWLQRRRWQVVTQQT